MIKIFSAQDKVFPLPLYHGTDRRLVEMGHKEVLFIHEQCQRIYPILLDLIKKELSISDLDNVFEWNRVLSGIKEEMRNLLHKLYPNIHPLLLKDKGNGIYQYGSFYLTSSLHAAERYADAAYCGGEFCDIVWQLLADFRRVWPDLFIPDETMQKALAAMKQLADGHRCPVVYRFPSVNCEYLQMESGAPLTVLFGELETIEDYSFRYTGPVDFDELEIAWENK